MRIYPTIKARHEQKHILPKDVRAFIVARVEEKKALTQSVPLPAAIPYAVESFNMPAKQKERLLISLKEILSFPIAIPTIFILAERIFFVYNDIMYV